MREGRRGAGVVVALVAIVALIAWLMRGGGDEVGDGRAAAHSPATAADIAPPPVFAAKEGEAGPSASQLATGETLSAPVPAATTGRLVVLVSWASDGTPAASVGLYAVPWAEPDALFRKTEGVTDAAGRWELADLRPGTVGLYLDRANGDNATIRAGETTELRLQIPAGVLVRGLVLDADQRPVAAAEIRLELGSDTEGPVVAHSDAAGRFTLRDVGTRLGAMVGATLAGHVPSPLARIEDSGTHVQDLTLQLGARGASLTGHVLDARGAPIAGAFVLVGPSGGWPLADEHAQLAFSGQPPRQLHTDAQGGFEAHDLPLGTVPVAARARGHGPWSGRSELLADRPASIEITLSDGAIVHGVVTDEADRPLAGASVASGEYASIEWTEAKSGADGHYELADLGPGDPQLYAWLKGAGKDMTYLHITAGARLEWNPRLAVGLQIHGRVVDEAGAPVAARSVNAHCDKPVPNGTWSNAETDEEGRFTLDNCQDGEHELQVYSPDWTTVIAELKGVRPGPGEVLLRVVPEAQPSAFVIGRVLDFAGQVPPDVRVWATEVSADSGEAVNLQPDGNFRIGPVKPGAWDIGVIGPKLPNWKAARITLAAGETLDVGALVLPEPGRILLHLTLPAGVLPDSIDCYALSGENGESFHPADAPPDTWDSGPLIPGDYKVHIRNYASGKEVAILSGEVAVRVEAGRTSQADFAAEAGVSLNFRLYTTRHDPPPMQLRVHDANGVELLAQSILWNDHGGARLAAWAGLVARPGACSLTIASEGKPLVERDVNVPAGVNAGPDVEVEVP